MSHHAECHQRFYVHGWVRFARGEQVDLADRFVADENGDLVEDERMALVIDADASPELFAALSQRFERQFFSTALGRWV